MSIDIHIRMVMLLA